MQEAARANAIAGVWQSRRGLVEGKGWDGGNGDGRTVARVAMGGRKCEAKDEQTQQPAQGKGAC